MRGYYKYTRKLESTDNILEYKHYSDIHNVYSIFDRLSPLFLSSMRFVKIICQL